MASEDFLQEYVEEVREHLRELEDSLLALERDGTSEEELSRLFRAAHSIKGASAYMGYEGLAGLTHELESLISTIQTHLRPVPPEGISKMLECVDFISGALLHLQQRGEEPILPPALMEGLQCALAPDKEPHQRAPEVEIPQPERRGEEPGGLPGAAPAQPDRAEDTEFEGEEGCPSDLEDRDTGMMEDPVEEEPEEDQELFEIFASSFRENMEELSRIFSGSVHAVPADSDFEKALNLTERLIGSSQYMDYPQVVRVLQEWEGALASLRAEERTDGYVLLEHLDACVQHLHRVMPSLELGSLLPEAGSEGDSGELLEGNAEESTEKEIEEEDDELYKIFLDSFGEHFLAMGERIPSEPSSSLSDEDFERVSGSIKRLISSSQYMGYDEVVRALKGYEDSLLEYHRSGMLDGSLYAQELNGFRKRVERLLPGLHLQAAEEVSAEQALLDMLDQQIDDSFSSLQSAMQTVAPQPDEQDKQLESNAEAAPYEEERMPEVRDEQLEEVVQDSSEKRVAKRGRISAVAEEVSASATLRVDAQKVDQLLNQLGELVVTRSEFVQSIASLKELIRELSSQGKLSKQELRRFRMLNFRFNESNVSLGRVANDLQDSVMRVRMLPIAHLLQRFPRIVRDQALKLGKKVELIIEGGETEIDKRVLEQMNDPLVQFLRNALVHGIEVPEERRQAGKPETGSIRLAAFHEGDYVAIVIEDDGRGIDTGKLRRMLRNHKAVRSQDLERLSDQEIMYAIFLPGISTYGRVDGAAGRGVGLDVVKENVERMNGSIEVESYLGQGTRFIIRIPLTVAIIRALLVRSAGQIFTLPLTSVSEILRCKPEETHTIEGFHVTTLRGRTIPLVWLDQLLNMADVDQHERSQRFIVIVSTSFREVGLVVDGLLGEREVVIKPIEDDSHTYEGFSGATILGDGAVSLILDVSALLRMMRDRAPNVDISSAPRRRDVKRIEHEALGS